MALGTLQFQVMRLQEQALSNAFVDGQRPGADGFANEPQLGERGALGQNGSQQGVGLGYLPGLNERANALSQLSVFLAHPSSFLKLRPGMLRVHGGGPC